MEKFFKNTTGHATADAARPLLSKGYSLLCLLFCLLSAVFDLSAQSLQWARPLTSGSAYISEAIDIKVDASDNVYVVGRFNGTVNFNPAGSGGVRTGSSDPFSYNAFIARYNPSGVLVWVNTFATGSSFDRIALHYDAGNTTILTVTGSCGTTLDLDPGTGVNTVGSGRFVTRYSGSTGAYVWATNSTVSGAVQADGSGNAYVVGTIDFPNNLSRLVKYNATGSLVGSVNFNGRITDLKLANGTLHVSGGDFGSSIVVRRYDMNLGSLSSITSINTPSAILYRIAVDAAGTVYGMGQREVNVNTTNQVWVASFLGSALGPLNTVIETGINIGPWGMDITNRNEVLITGWFQGANVNFNNGNGSTTPVTATSGGGGTRANPYIAKYSTLTSQCVWVRSVEGTAGTGSSKGCALTFANEHFYTIGLVAVQTVNANPCSGPAVNITDNNSFTGYFAKYVNSDPVVLTARYRCSATSIPSACFNRYGGGFRPLSLGTGPNFNCIQQTEIAVDPHPSLATLNWSVVSKPANVSITYLNSGFSVFINGMTESQSVVLSLTASNSCATVTRGSITIVAQCNSMGGFAMYPNPADTKVTVQRVEGDMVAVNMTDASVVENAEASPDKEKEFDVEVYDRFAQLVLAKTKIKDKSDINVSGLKNGLYLVKVKDANNAYQYQLLVNR